MSFSKQTGFNKTFCICHRKGATKPGKQLTLFLWQASKALLNMTGTIAWRASEESALYLLLCRVLLFTDFPVCISWPLPPLKAFSFPPSHFSHFFSTPSESPLVCCQSHPCWSEMNTVSLMSMQQQQQNKLLLPYTETSIYPDLDLAVIAQTDDQSKAHHTLGAKIN